MCLRFFLVCCAVIFGSAFGLSAQGLRWEPTNGPYSSSVFCFAANDSIIVAGASDNLFRSNDSGKTWTKLYSDYIISTQRPLLPITSLSPLQNDGTLYAGTPFGVTCLNTEGGTVTCTTTPSGVTCIRNVTAGVRTCTTGINRQRISAVIANNSDAFVGTDIAGVFRHSNGTWSPYNVGLTASISALAYGGNVLYAGSPLGIYRSTNRGLEWTAVNTGLANKSIQAIAATESIIFAATEGGVFRSQDSGTTWTSVNNGLTELNAKNIMISGSTVFVATSTGTVFRSTDNGSRWVVVQYDFKGSPVVSLGKFRGIIFAGTQGSGIFRSLDNGISWEQSSYGLTQVRFSSFFSVNSALFATSGENLYSLVNNGTEWQSVSRMPLSFTDFISLGKTVFASNRYSFSNSNYRSNDLGKTWKQISIEFDFSMFDRVMSVVSTPPYLLSSLTEGKVFLSADTGKTWKSTVSHGVFLARMYAVPDSRVIYALSLLDSNGKRSNDNGLTWNPFNNSRFDPSAILRNGASFLAATYRGLQRSNDEGATWSVTQFQDTALTSLVAQGTTMFLSAARRGVFRSSDNGVSWSAVNNGLNGISELDVQSLILYQGALWAATSNGIFRAILPGLTTSVNLTQSSLRSLSSKHSIAIYPNPTSDFITVEAAPECASTPLRLTLRNALGAVLLTLEAQSTDGLFRKEVNVAHLSPGAYSLEMICGGERLVARFVRF